MKPNFRNENKEVNIGVGTTFTSRGNTFTLVEVGYCNLAVLHKWSVLHIEYARKFQVQDSKHITEKEFTRITDSFQKKFLDSSDITIVTEELV